jgi:hypothetical protein
VSRPDPPRTRGKRDQPGSAYLLTYASLEPGSEGFPFVMADIASTFVVALEAILRFARVAAVPPSAASPSLCEAEDKEGLCARWSRLR